MNKAMQFLNAILDLIFPPRCEACASIGPEAFCAACRSKITHLLPSAFVHSVAIYEDPLKKVLMKFKYKRRLHLSRPLGEIMAKYVRSNFDISRVDFIIPVPLHHKRQSERGFNQAEALSHELSRHFGIPTVSGILHRIRETAPQFNLPPKDRYNNVKGAFAVNNCSFLRDKRVLLLDDIYTTGSTISECTRVLKETGTRDVHVLTLSRALAL